MVGLRPITRVFAPRDAATLIIVRRDCDAPRLLMGVRHRRHHFMPGKVVFPGGRVDRCDYALPLGGDLSAQTRAMLLRAVPGKTSQRRARAIALAAIRESFEETGLLVGRQHAVSGVHGPIVWLAPISRTRSRSAAWHAQTHCPSHKPRRASSVASIPVSS